MPRSPLPAADPAIIWNYAAERTYANEIDNSDDYGTVTTFLDIAGPDALVLDIGCGFGRTAAMIKSHNLAKSASVRYVGVDCSDAMLDLARAAVPDGDFRQGRWGALSEVSNETFDAFIANRSIALLSPEELAAALIDLRSRLRVGAVGYFVADLGDEALVVKHSRKNPHIPKGTQVTFRRWTPEAMQPLLEAAGLRGGLVRVPCGCHFELFVDAV